MGSQAIHTASPPRWRWMIICSRFGWSFIVLGSFKSLGVFLPHFVRTFSTSTAIAGLISSFLLGFGLFTCGPFIGALLKVWNSRQLTIAGGLLASVATMVASFSSSMAQLSAMFALMSIGIAVIQVSAVKPIMDYFPASFATANGLSLCGGTIGMMVLPLVMEQLVELYGWRIAFALMGAFSLNFVVCGALLRPLRVSYTRLPDKIDDEDAGTRKSGGQSDGSLPPNGEKGRSKLKNAFLIILQFVRERFDTQALTDPVFVVYQASCVLNGMVYSMWHLFLIPQGLELGFGDAPSALLATYGGLGALVGRLGHGWVVDRDLVSASTLLALSSLVFAVSCYLDPLVTSCYEAVAALATVAGVAIGAMFPLCFVVMRDITGDGQISAFSWVFLSHGAGQLAGGLLAGLIHDVSGMYEFAFVAMGAAATILVAILVLTRYLMRAR